MKLVLIPFFITWFSNNFLLQPSTPPNGVQLISLEYDSMRIVNDSIPAAKVYVGPTVEVQVKYNFVLLDRFVIGDIVKTTILDNRPIEKAFIYPAGSIVSLTTTDKNSSLESIYVKFDNAPEKRYSEAIRLSAKGNHKMVIKLRDQWGGEMVSDAINFKVLSY